MELAENLIKIHQNVTAKRRGRPRTDAEENLEILSTPRARKVDSSHPTNDVRKNKFC